jgi:hypothetical protein
MWYHCSIAAGSPCIFCNTHFCEKAIFIVIPKYHNPMNGPKSKYLSEGGIGNEIKFVTIIKREIFIPVRANIFPNLGCLKILIANKSVPKNIYTSQATSKP